MEESDFMISDKRDFLDVGPVVVEGIVFVVLDISTCLDDGPPQNGFRWNDPFKIPILRFGWWEGRDNTFGSEQRITSGSTKIKKNTRIFCQ